MAIEIVDFPIKKGDFPWQNVSSPEGKARKLVENPTKISKSGGCDKKRN